jgi:hypothetical protein
MCEKINMSDMLLDNVNSLLDGDFGDDRILKQIARACKNNEVISNYERNYVQKLAEQYLGQKPKIISPKEPENTIIIPDVVIPKIEPTVQAQIFEPTPSTTRTNLKNSKLILGFGGVAVIIIAAILFSFSSTDSITSNSGSEIKSQLTLETDFTSYSQNDIISIHGMSSTRIVNLTIENQINELVWAEQISVNDNQKYSTLAIAGGPGWENSGTYTLMVDTGSDIKSVTFSFTS